ncbi:hypothetical protein G6F56_010974 [Rhizopus delemar]|nr:hypothetical protein G6F56_010974 [Rhizopus delemar]
MGPSKKKSFNPLASTPSDNFQVQPQDFSDLQATVRSLIVSQQEMTVRLQPLEALQQELLQLKSENARLLELTQSQANEIAALRAEKGNLPVQTQRTVLEPASATASISTAPANGPIASEPSTIRPNGASASSWATVASRSGKNKARRMESEARHFRPATGEKGFTYVYISRSHRMTHSEARRRLGRLGVESWRVLDVCFPAHSVAGLLVHVQYKDSLVALMAKAKIPVLDSFDPFDHEHLADPRFKESSIDVRRQEISRIVLQRSCVALDRLRFPVAVSVGRFFLENGLISDEALSDVLNSKSDRPRYYRHRDDPPSEMDMDERRHSVASTQRSL